MDSCEHCGGLGILTDTEYGGLNCPFCDGEGKENYDTLYCFTPDCPRIAKYVKTSGKKITEALCKKCYLKETKK